ncbi:hypothetical protein SpCBS45565_g05989 [Spizellomyces sp. 'palustris']|nr:hypothetical protein SpCBS45565_g05989 [Spizellomyces sp. 'palustris']
MVVTRNGAIIAMSEDSVTLGRDHMPSAVASTTEIDSPVANVDTVPSMNIPRSAFEKKFHAKEDAFKDLTRFEERLRFNMYKRRRSETYWGVGFSILFIILLWCLYQIFTNKRVDEQGISIPNSWHVFGVTVLVSAITIFVTTGTLRTTMLYSTRYIQRCNSALRPFNMEFNKDRKGGISFLQKVPPEFQDGYEKYRTEFWRQQPLKKKKKG